MPKVFIILLNWNNWHETQECLESLRSVHYNTFEILVVDNNSGAEERQIIKGFTIYDLRFTILWNKENLGFAGGNNVGIKYALEQGADYVMLLNNDAIVAPDFLDALVRTAQSNTSFGILGSRIYKYGAGEVVFDGGKVNFWLTKGLHQILSGSDPDSIGVRPRYFLCDYITGAAMLVKREVIEKIGLMREEYFLYHEDVDWCIRARRAGYKCVLVPTSKVWHKVSATNKEGSPSYIYYHTRNGLMLAKFNGNVLQKVAAYTFGALVLLKQMIKFVIFPSKRFWAIAMSRGVLDFYKNKYGKYSHLS